MDLFNNSVGRRIASENPRATVVELAQLVADAVNNGEAVVIDGNNELAFSNDVKVGATGRAEHTPKKGEVEPADKLQGR